MFKSPVRKLENTYNTTQRPSFSLIKHRRIISWRNSPSPRRSRASERGLHLKVGASASGLSACIGFSIEFVDRQIDGQGQADKLGSVLRAGFFQDPFDVGADSFASQILDISNVPGSQTLGN